MKKLLLFSLLALALLLSWSCQRDDQYLDSSEDTTLQTREAKKYAETPFYGEYTTYPEILDQTGEYILARIESEGKATHLGKSEWEGEGFINLTVFPFTQEGPSYFVAANKDTLFCEYSGTVAFGPPGPLFAGEGEYIFSGGTGRFVDASGSGIYYYEVNPNAEGELVGHLVWEGVLINP